MSPALAGRFFTTSASREAHPTIVVTIKTVSQAKLSDYKPVRNDHLHPSTSKQKMTSDFYLSEDNPKWLNFKNKNLLACNLL